MSHANPALAAATTGLRTSGARRLLPFFSALMTVLFTEVLALLIIPFLATKGADGGVSGAQLALSGIGIVSGLTLGAVVAIVADRRGRSAWWMLPAQIGAVASPLIAVADASPLAMRLSVFGLSLLGAATAMYFVRATVTEPAPHTRLTRALGRFWWSVGDIRLGIGIMLVMAVALFAGTWWESAYGSRSAKYVFYTSSWFGGLFLLFAASLIAATVRKYPFRLDQTGWLATHAALVGLIIASFMTFWGKEEGELALAEGQTASVFALDTETRLAVDVLEGSEEAKPRWTPVWETIADFDLDPSVVEPDRRYPVDTTIGSMDLLVDRYFANARPSAVTSNDYPHPRFALEGEVVPPGGTPVPFTLAEGDPERTRFDLGGLLKVVLSGRHDELFIQSLRGGRDRTGHGHLVVRSEEGGVELLRVPLEPANEKRERGTPATLPLDMKIPGTGLSIVGIGWYDCLRFSHAGSAMDVAPSLPAFPAAHVALVGPKGREERYAAAFEPAWSRDANQRKQYADLIVELDYIPEFPIAEGSVYLAAPTGGEPFWVSNGADGRRRSGRIVAGEAFDLGVPITIRPRRVFDHYRINEGYELAGYRPGNQMIRVRVAGAEGASTHWVRLDGEAAFGLAGQRFRVRWSRTRRDLGFALRLDDFRREFHPGSEEPSAFESHLTLDHARLGQAVPVKIDMNHPLRLDGWRLYQARYDIRGTEMSFLQVNRDPGLPLMFLSCALLTLAMVVVFFQKPYLRLLERHLEQSGASAARRCAAGFATLGGAFAATVPAVVLYAVSPEGPLVGLAALLAIVGLIVETLIVNLWLKRRLTRSTGLLPSTGA